MEDKSKKQGKSIKQARKFFPKTSWKNIGFSILLMMIWVFSAVIVSQFIVGYLMIWILGSERFNDAVWMAVYSALTYCLAMFLILYVPKKIAARKSVSSGAKGETTEKGHETSTGISKIELGLRGLPTWTDIGLSLAGFVAYLILAAIVVAIFSIIFPWFNATETQELGFNLYAVGLDRIVAFATLVVVAPIAEEVIFRGWLYGKMREKFNLKVPNWASTIISMFLVSLLFGIVHLQWNVGVNVFAMSIILCGLREITGTIYAGILLHMLKNGVAFYLLFILGM